MKKVLLIIALLLGFFIRSFEYKANFMYAHDNDLASWMFKDIVVDHHLRLVGQLTSAPGIFIGPLFYYALIPFYLLTNMDPIGTVAFSWIIGIVSVASIYYVFKKLYGSVAAASAALIHSVSYAIAFSEREVVPTTPVFLWSIWFFYAVNQLFRGHKSALLILAVLFALVWHLNLALGLLAPLVVIGLWQMRKRLTLKDLVMPLILFVFLSTPLLLFEVKHEFQQTRALVTTLTSLGHGPEKPTRQEKIAKTILYAARNANSIYSWEHRNNKLVYVFPTVLFVALLWLSVRQKDKYSLVIYPLWLFLYILFFSFHSINLSEYYLNGLHILWTASGALIFNSLYKSNKWGKILASVLMMLFLYVNLNVILTSGTPQIGYIQKKNLTAHIAADALAHDYPCVSVSYMTEIGYNFGFRYMFWLNGLHVNQPSSMSPVYTIVYPIARADKVDRTFGLWGLVYPDYSRYTKDEVAISCSGDDANLTDPMFGFTK